MPDFCKFFRRQGLFQQPGECVSDSILEGGIVHISPHVDRSTVAPNDTSLPGDRLVWSQT